MILLVVLLLLLLLFGYGGVAVNGLIWILFAIVLIALILGFTGERTWYR